VRKAWGQDVEIIVKGSVAGKPFTEEGRYAVVDVCGPLNQHEQWLCDDYDSIRGRVAAAIASGQEAVCLRLNTPGGDFAGCLELGRELRAMCDAAGKELDGFTDSQALSAGYAMAAVCNRVSITPSAFVGSVGIWAPLIDVTSQDAMMGQAVVIVSSGEAKADRNPHVKISEAAVERLQEQVDAQATLFYEHVAQFRGMAPAAIKALRGADVFGEAAVAAGLADEVVDSWATYIAQGSASAASSKGTAMSKYDEALGAMRRAAEEDSEDGKKAKKALKAMEDGEESTEEKKDEKEAKASKAEKEKEKEGEGEGDAKALALQVARDLHTFKLEQQAKAEGEERTALLASRPDFEDSVRAFLAKQPIESVREAVKTFPRAARRFQPAAASLAMPSVQGNRQGEFEAPLSAEEDALINRAMGSPEPTRFALGCGDVNAARKYLKDKETAAKAAAGV
jgi:ClpP class serine protease